MPSEATMADDFESRRLPADAGAVAEAAAILKAGGLVGFPTETVYGLGADAGNDRAMARLFEAKGRPRFNPLIVHVASKADAARLARLDSRAEALAARFWPGPLTLVLARRADCGISLLASAGLDTLAIRVPDHPTARTLLQAAGRPIAAPSANRSGMLSPTTAAHVVAGLNGRVDLVLDGGPCPVGIESTIVDLSVAPAALLRPGGLAAADIEAVVGPLAPPDGGGAVKSPGRLVRHYAPSHPIRLAATAAADDEALIAFGPEVPAGARVTFNLSRGGDLVEAAANLFAMLHAADRAEVAAIAVMAIPDRGLGLAINDRLRRAAAGAR